MRKRLNLELVQFHVHEAACELASLVARLHEAQGESLNKSEKIMAYSFSLWSAVKVNLEHSGERVCVGNRALVASDLYYRAGHGGYLYLIEVNLIFKIQATHKSAAVSGDLVGVEGKPLLLCHFNGYLGKI